MLHHLLGFDHLFFRFQKNVVQGHRKLTLPNGVEHGNGNLAFAKDSLSCARTHWRGDGAERSCALTQLFKLPKHPGRFAWASKHGQPVESQLGYCGMMIRFFSCCAFLLLGTLVVGAADDKPATPTLAQALGTNVVGTHTFSPAWTGQCAVVHATGVFSRPEPPVMATNRYRVKFDTVVVPPKAQIGNVGQRSLARAEKDGGYSALHTQRDNLPGDAKLQSAKTRADLEKLLGQPQGFPSNAGEGGDRVSWSAFALNK